MITSDIDRTSKIVGKTIKGSSSGVTARVVTYITDKESEKGNYTLYVAYLESGDGDGVCARVCWGGRYIIRTL